ncbi:EAL domain-containing protein [Methylobacterium sp. E-005]|nr:EAL domain-containing protein [Methylobacterium sp. E-005]
MIAERLNVAVIAEGVETEAELTSFRSLGIDLFQGYLSAKPTVARLPPMRFSASYVMLVEALSQSNAA